MTHKTYELAGHNRLLSVDDVAEITGTCNTTAAKIIKETGRPIKLHRRLYVLDTALCEYLEALSAQDGDE